MTGRVCIDAFNLRLGKGSGIVAGATGNRHYNGWALPFIVWSGAFATLTGNATLWVNALALKGTRPGAQELNGHKAVRGKFVAQDVRACGEF